MFKPVSEALMGILHASTTYLYCNSLLTNHLNTAQTSSSKTHRSYISVTSLVALDRTPGQNYLLKQKEKRSPYTWTCLTGGRGPVLHMGMSHRWAWACLTHGHVSQVCMGLSYTWTCLTGGRGPVLQLGMSHRSYTGTCVSLKWRSAQNRKHLLIHCLNASI